MKFENGAGHRAVEYERNTQWTKFIERVRVELYGGKRIPDADLIRIKRELGFLQQDGRPVK